jgi:hypothetical protein
MYNDRITAAANRSSTTDFAAPAIDVPTFRRTFSLTGTTTTGTSTSAAGDPLNHLTFTQVGTSMSSAIVTGAYSLTSSALNYWISLSQGAGVTSDAYLTTPVGVNTLNFGQHAIKDLSAYNTPDGINGILAYTAVPAADVNDAGSLSTPPLIGTTDGQYHYQGSTSPPSYARVSVSNAIASIEGTIAINYLLSHNTTLPLIDTNGDGIITAQEVQNFTDTAATKGLAEAGAMARLLGGTSTYAQPETGPNNTTFNENPDQPGALQRRFNYFDYVANGQLKGGIAISSFHMLANTLLPQPDSNVIIDRQRASANGFLVDPLAQRNLVNLQHLLPKYMFVPKSAIAKYRNVSPANFHVNRNQAPGTALPFYALFGGGSASVNTGTPVVNSTSSGGQVLSVLRVPLLPASSSTPAATSTTSANVAPTSTTSNTTPAKPSTTSGTTGSAAVASNSTSGAQAGTGAAGQQPAPTNAQAFIAAANQLAKGASVSSTSPNNLVTAGTLTPVAQTTSATSATTASTSTTTASQATTAASTTTVTPTTTATPAAAATASPAATAAANQQQQAARQVAASKAQAKKKGDFWSKLWKSFK